MRCAGLARFLGSAPASAAAPLRARERATLGARVRTFIAVYGRGMALILSEGKVRLTLETGSPHPKLDTVFLRIPGWARNQPVPGDLYRFADHVDAVGDRIHLHWPAQASLVLADDGGGTADSETPS